MASSVIVSYDDTHGRDKTILLVGEQKNEVVNVINAFQGLEAEMLWSKITKKKESI